jgi:hypothetical protein
MINGRRIELLVTPIWPESGSLILAPQKPESESESKSRLRSRLQLFFLIPAKMLQVFFVCQLSIALDLKVSISVKLTEN